MNSRFRGALVRQLRWAWALLFLLAAPALAPAQAPAESDLNLKGAIDFRVHSGPDSDNRTADADDVARIGRQMGMPVTWFSWAWVYMYGSRR